MANQLTTWIEEVELLGVNLGDHQSHTQESKIQFLHKYLLWEFCHWVIQKFHK